VAFGRNVPLEDTWQCPDLEPTVTKLPNAFGIWDRKAPKSSH
jgi:hypothetical protein